MGTQSTDLQNAPHSGTWLRSFQEAEVSSHRGQGGISADSGQPSSTRLYPESSGRQALAF